MPVCSGAWAPDGAWQSAFSPPCIGDADDLHAVAGRLNGGGAVARSDEHDVAQCNRGRGSCHGKPVLFRSDFNGARRVAVLVATEFVDFVEHEQGVGRSAFSSSAGCDRAWHRCTFCGALGFPSSRSPQAHPHVFTTKGFGDAASSDVFRHRRTVQAMMGPRS